MTERCRSIVSSPIRISNRMRLVAAAAAMRAGYDPGHPYLLDSSSRSLSAGLTAGNKSSANNDRTQTVFSRRAASRPFLPSQIAFIYHGYHHYTVQIMPRLPTPSFTYYDILYNTIIQYIEYLWSSAIQNCSGALTQHETETAVNG